MPKKKKVTNVSQRTVKVFAESKEQLERWKKAATNAGTSLSRFLREITDAHISGDKAIKESYEYENKIIGLQKQNSIIMSENNQLQKALERTKQNLEILETELHEIKYGPFLDKDFSGKRQINQELVKLFKKKGRLREENIATLLHIDPADSKTNEIVLNQINTLIEYGLIHRWRGGYEWKK